VRKPCPIRRTSRSSIPSSDEAGRGWLGWRIIRVRCRSMVPTLDGGDHVLLKCYGRFRRPRPAEVACIRRGDGPMLIKRLGARDGNGRFGPSGDGEAASAPAIDPGYASEREIVGRGVLRVSGTRIRLVRGR